MTHWAPSAFSQTTSNVVAKIDEHLLDEEVVMLLKGRNSFNDRIYSYIQITLRNLRKMREAIQRREEFLPSDFGTVLAAGQGEPDDELRTEMTRTYRLVDVKPSLPSAPPPAAANVSQPSLWDGE